jgi:excisionase family DNA binding protein
MNKTLTRTRSEAADPLRRMAGGLARKLAAPDQPSTQNLLAQALHELLDGQGEESRNLRTDVQIHLAMVSNFQIPDVAAVASKQQEMLSTQEAAQLMGCSRPYVAMLIDAGTLEGGVTSKGGHRKVPKASILRWIELNRTTGDADKNYRKAAAEAGMYAISEDKYRKAGARKRPSGV